jgi:two-component system chemotaxis response regulator CheY
MKKKPLKTVFIVEDSAVERSMLKDYLSKYKKLTIKEFSTGNACIKEIVIGKTTEPDLIVMDYFLDSTFGPSKDGLESLAKVKEICPDAGVIMFTSVANPKIMDLAKTKGALDYVVKGTSGFDDLDSVLKKHYELN